MNPELLLIGATLGLFSFPPSVAGVFEALTELKIAELTNSIGSLALMIADRL